MNIAYYNIKNKSSTGKSLGFTSGSYEYYFRYNLQGDVTGLINASTGSVDAIYEYDAHGNIISRTAKNSIATNLTLRNIYLYRGAYGYFYEKNSGCTICRPASMTRLWADSSMRMIRITSTQAVQRLGVISMRIVRIMGLMPVIRKVMTPYFFCLRIR